MDDFSIVNVLHAEANLCEPVQNLILRERPASLRLDPSLQVATIAEVHNDTEFSSFGFEHFDERDDVWVAERFQKPRLLQGFFLLAF